ncbi:hypothetical protein V6N12_043212 [Hibiscus sabdariffa]|uniref:Myb-like domain-containing protein n=1 Tax=Hibiscus sabdariffa TaxID=183260 RepID=A0ABR2DDN1_9ROSI
MRRLRLSCSLHSRKARVVVFCPIMKKRTLQTVVQCYGFYSVLGFLDSGIFRFHFRNPALNLGTWTEEEDSRLQAAIEEHGYCWSKIATWIINDSEAETASGHDSVRTIRRNTPLENNKCSHSTSTRSFLSNEKTERTTFRTNNHTEPAHVTVQEKRRQLPSGHTNYSDQVQDDAVQTERRKQPESSKCIESVRTKIIRSLLACFLRNKSKKRRQETVGNSQLSTLEEMDERSKVQDLTREPSKLIEEDITLACWCKQLKKRVATVAACPDESNKRVGSKYI